MQSNMHEVRSVPRLLQKAARMAVVGVAAAALLGQLTGVKITPAFAGNGPGVPFECFVEVPIFEDTDNDPTTPPELVGFDLEPTDDPCLADCCEKAERCLARAGGDFLKTAHCFDRFENCEAKCPGFGDGDGPP